MGNGNKVNFEEAREYLEQFEQPILLPDGYEDALVGYVQKLGDVHAMYDQKKCIDILVERDGMTWEEAEEFFQFNTLGAYVEGNLPVFCEYFEDILGVADGEGVSEGSVEPSQEDE